MSQPDAERMQIGRRRWARGILALLVAAVVVLLIAWIWISVRRSRIGAERAFQVVSERLLSADSTVVNRAKPMSMEERRLFVAWLQAHWPQEVLAQASDWSLPVGGSQDTGWWPAPDICVECDSTYIDPATGQGMPTHMQILGFAGPSGWVNLYVPQVNAADDWCQVVIPAPPPVELCRESLPPPSPPPPESSP